MSEDDVEEGEDEVYLGVYEGGRNEKGERHGFGKAILPNHDTYEGMYENGLRNGKGYYLFKNGARYLGEYFDNRKHGQGTFYYPDGSRYEGYWVDDKRNGHGTYFYTNGDTYEGEWRDHLRHGKGTYTFAVTGCKFVGVWRDGLMDGSGEVINAKYRFLGMWRKGQLIGEGKYVFDKLNCQQTGEYLLLPGEPEEKRQGDDDSFTVSRWRARAIEVARLDEPATEVDVSEMRSVDKDICGFSICQAHVTPYFPIFKAPRSNQMRAPSSSQAKSSRESVDKVDPICTENPVDVVVSGDYIRQDVNSAHKEVEDAPCVEVTDSLASKKENEGSEENGVEVQDGSLEEVEESEGEETTAMLGSVGKVQTEASEESSTVE
ncbi:unnamed protein product [Hydatigera taeniaeformis]|uniref:Radial spoke head 1 homolog n=1 Tax=Hydatigena taeniaeformis TaxID=6205 RepID=A0A0R3WNQ6_HYDTA|nr:unnamed protein product [Hydatigera taeniaeformis]